MSKQKLTEWFPANVKPVRKGFYQREYESEWMIGYCDFWDGEEWILMSITGLPTGPVTTQLRWRGLASDPSKP